MLQSIHIKDYAIIDEVSLDMRRGLTVLTGETGAGKSILLDAIGLVLGDRADSQSVRHGAEKAQITVTFDIQEHAPAKQWLRDLELDDEELVIRRVITQDGRSKCFINATPASVAQLKTLGELLVDIHGQHAHQSLSKSSTQRDILDFFASNSELLDKVNDIYKSWRALQQRLKDLGHSQSDQGNRAEFLRFQLEELQALSIKSGEVEALTEEHKKLHHAGDLIEQVQCALTALNDDDDQSAYRQLTKAQHALEQALRYDEQLKGVHQLVNDAVIAVQECENELTDYLDHAELDPERLQWLEQRLSKLMDLARKHRCEPETLCELETQLSKELEDLTHAESRIETCQQQIKQLETDYLTLAEKISSSRKKAAKKLAKTVTQYMHELGMSGGSFVIDVNFQAQQSPSVNGGDWVEFKVSTNPGTPPQALAKVASGGELSRISLALEVAAQGNTQIPTLIFDEVDAGISGATAEVVGQKLRELGKAQQVLCITHLPQVAAQGHHHLKVEKQIDLQSKSTQTSTRELTSDERVEELARLLGGSQITKASREHAAAMIGAAQRH